MRPMLESVTLSTTLPDTSVLSGWQYKTASTGSLLVKNTHFKIPLGHDTTIIMMPRSGFMLVQASLNGAYPFCNDDVFLLALS